MSFVERVIEHVRRVQQGAEGEAHDRRVVIDYGRHRRVLLEAYEGTERSAGQRPPHRVSLRTWLDGRLERFVNEMHWRLIGWLGEDTSEEERVALVDHGMLVVSGLEPIRVPNTTRARLELVDELATGAWQDIYAWSWQDVPGYCVALRLIDESHGRWAATAAGHMLLGLRGRDAARWLLLLETMLAIGPDDPWRVEARSLEAMLAEPYVLRWQDESQPPFPLRWHHAQRLEAFGIVESFDDHGEWGWTLTKDGGELLRGVLDVEVNPFGVLARAVLDDELQQILVSRTAGDRTAERIDATLRHARMVAHEVRNALGPVQHAARKLRGEIGKDTSSPPILEQLDAIDGGVRRLYRFVTESVRLVPPESQRSEPFSVLDAIAEARKELGPDGLGSLTIETLPVSADPRCQGNRGHFVMAMLNVLRNAQQVAGHDVRIAIRIDGRDPSHTLLSIDDDGPGVPDAVREHIFENGVSYREDGTGHGLASLRAVVEDIGGKVRCTKSDLGGARFEIMLPAAEDFP